jgi:NADPH2:quinone reductase
MNAIVVRQFGGPEVMALEEVPRLSPGPGGVLVAVKAAGVNPFEAYQRSGNYARKPPLPYTPGADGAGVVEAVGAGVTRFKPGDRVYAFSGAGHSGTYAQQLLAPEASLQHLPANTSFSQGAALGVPYATAHYGLFHRGQARPGESVLVHGASGGVGIGAVQIARAAGLTVFGTASTEAGRKALLEDGAHAVFDHSQPGYFERILAATQGRGLDLILEMLANVNLDQDLKGLSLRGRVIVIGSRGRVEIDPRDTMGRDADIRGFVLFNAGADELRSIHSALYAGLENGTLRPRVATELPLAQAPRAHVDVQSTKVGKIVLIP